MQKSGVKWREKKGNSRRNWGNGRVEWKGGGLKGLQGCVVESWGY